MFRTLFLILLTSSTLIAEITHSYFIPPKSWSLAEPEKDKPHLRVKFFDRKGDAFGASINLAVEEVELSLPEYLKVVKGLHEKDPNKSWRMLGKVKTKSGDATLTQIDIHSTERGSVRILQMILVKDKKAYVMSAATTKASIPSYYKVFNEAFHSFTITTDLISCIPESSRREKLQSLLQTKPPLENLEKTITHDFSDLGSYWQLLLLTEILTSKDAC